ncbi:8928_t:CDS:2, partial [Cetraspora pellucida]
LREQTIIQYNDHGQPELLTARNDPYINSHNHLQLQGWRANVDLKPILTTYAALQYVSNKHNEHFIKSFQKLLLYSVAERDFSSQETCHLLLGIPLFYCSQRTLSWPELYDHHLQEIVTEPVDVLGLATNSLEENINNDEYQSDKESEETQLDWMILVETCPDNQPYNSSDLGIENHEINDSVDSVINYETLNKKQKTILDRIECNYIANILGKCVEPLRIIIMSTAKTKKSYLIKAIWCKLNEITLSIPVNAKTFDLTGESLKCLQNKLKWVKYFIINEMSMVGQHTLALIDLRMHQAFPNCQNIPFDGRSIIFVRDFGQLPPVCDLPMYAQDSRPSDALSEDGRTAYIQF